MTLAFIAFTQKGKALADSLCAVLGGESMRCGEPLDLHEWTARHFCGADGLVFIGAAGIAVRAVAPYVRDKASDPAVVVVDECARFAVPILSGHLGGANDLARALARACGAIPVITTATDANGVFAVDQWARRQDCAVANPNRIKRVSAVLLGGGTVRVRSDWPIAGEPPAGVSVTDAEACDVLVSVHTGDAGALWLVPRIAVLGIGCRRGTAQEAIEAAYAAAIIQAGLDAHAVCEAATIDLKEGEPGLCAFCQAHGWPLRVFSAQQLRRAEGDFASSDFVQSITAVDNVCERAAALAAGGPLVCRKKAINGVTIAVALKPYAPTWRW